MAGWDQKIHLPRGCKDASKGQIQFRFNSNSHQPARAHFQLFSILLLPLSQAMITFWRSSGSFISANVLGMPPRKSRPTSPSTFSTKRFTNQEAKLRRKFRGGWATTHALVATPTGRNRDLSLTGRGKGWSITWMWRGTWLERAPRLILSSPRTLSSYQIPEWSIGSLRWSERILVVSLPSLCAWDLF